jgi:hypothetical protein
VSDPYSIVRVVGVDPRDNNVVVLWEVHHPYGYRVATFYTYPGACKHVKAQTGAKHTEAFLESPRKAP